MVRPLRRYRTMTPSEPVQVVEMGPGTGAITLEIARLLRPGDRLDCYEIDDGFASYLRERVATDELFEAIRDGVRVHVMPAQEARLDSAAQFVICSMPLNNLAPALYTTSFIPARDSSTDEGGSHMSSTSHCQRSSGASWAPTSVNASTGSGESSASIAQTMERRRWSGPTCRRHGPYIGTSTTDEHAL